MKKSLSLFYILAYVAVLLTACQMDGEGFQNRRVIRVAPGESIQDKLDQADPGDIISVSPGIYKPEVKGEAFIVFREKHSGVTLKGAGEGPEEVILDGDQKVLHVIYFDQGIGRDTVISNLTIKGGYAFPEEILPSDYNPILRKEIGLKDDFYHDGGGIMVYNASPTIKGNIITGNATKHCGGGISSFSSQDSSIFSYNRWKKLFTPGEGPLIYGNIFSHNTTLMTGGGVDVYYWARAVIINNLFEANISNRAGGAIAILDKANAEIRSNTIVQNSAEKYGSGIAVYRKARSVIISDNIFAFNRASNVIESKGGEINVISSCFYGNEGNYVPPESSGNITDTPLFVSNLKESYFLSKIDYKQSNQSPCLGKGWSPEYTFK